MRISRVVRNKIAGQSLPQGQLSHVIGRKRLFIVLHSVHVGQVVLSRATGAVQTLYSMSYQTG